MKTRYMAALAIAVIFGGVGGCILGAWLNDLAISVVSMMVFVVGFLAGKRVVEGLPDGDDSDEDPIAD